VGRVGCRRIRRRVLVKLPAAPLGGARVLWLGGGNVDEEGAEGFGDWEGGDEEIQRGVYSARKRVGGVVGAGNVLGVDCAPVLSQGGLNAFEDFVGGAVATAAPSPGLDDALVVSENLEMKVGGTGVECGEYQELESDTFSPTDVAPSSLPRGGKLPCAPEAVERDTDADF
jgi:hypothetical protein